MTQAAAPVLVEDRGAVRAVTLHRPATLDAADEVRRGAVDARLDGAPARETEPAFLADLAGLRARG